MIELFGPFLIGAIGTVCAQNAKPAFPVMSPIEQYREASASAEVALARTAAPTSISGDASVLVLGNQGYETAVKGKNGFVCLVWRSWAATLDDPDFWNPKFRAPICFNPAASRTVLPAYLERTKWALAGASKPEIENRIRAALASNRIATPEPGAMACMMSRGGDDGSGHHFPPHVMMFLAHTDGADWGAGAGFHGSPIIVEQQYPEPFTVFDVKVPWYSDGTPTTSAATQDRTSAEYGTS
jgi:hypothetical protein